MLGVALESITFGLAVAGLVVGLVGTIIPLVPGTLLVWLVVLLYGLATDFSSISMTAFVVITLIALVTGTADIWMPLLGSRKTGAGGRSMVYGVIGAIVGTFALPLLGTIIGYALGILLGEFQTHRDWNLAFKSSLGGIAGWGLATAVQLGGALLILIIFVVQVLLLT